MYKTGLNNQDFSASTFFLIVFFFFLTCSLGPDGAMDASAVQAYPKQKLEEGLPRTSYLPYKIQSKQNSANEVCS